MIIIYSSNTRVLINLQSMNIKPKSTQVKPIRILKL